MQAVYNCRDLVITQQDRQPFLDNFALINHINNSSTVQLFKYLGVVTMLQNKCSDDSSILYDAMSSKDENQNDDGS